MPHERTLGIQQHERLAGLGIVQHLLDEADRIAAPALERGAVERNVVMAAASPCERRKSASDGCCFVLRRSRRSRRTARSANRLNRTTSSSDLRIGAQCSRRCLFGQRLQLRGALDGRQQQRVRIGLVEAEPLAEGERQLLDAPTNGKTPIIELVRPPMVAPLLRRWCLAGNRAAFSRRVHGVVRGVGHGFGPILKPPGNGGFGDPDVTPATVWPSKDAINVCNTDVFCAPARDREARAQAFFRPRRGSDSGRSLQVLLPRPAPRAVGKRRVRRPRASGIFCPYPLIDVSPISSSGSSRLTPSRIASKGSLIVLLILVTSAPGN